MRGGLIHVRIHVCYICGWAVEGRVLLLGRTHTLTHVYAHILPYLIPRRQGRDVVQHGAGLREGHAVLELLDEAHLLEVEVVVAVLRQGLLAVFFGVCVLVWFGCCIFGVCVLGVVYVVCGGLVYVCWFDLDVVYVFMIWNAWCARSAHYVCFRMDMKEIDTKTDLWMAAGVRVGWPMSCAEPKRKMRQW